MCDDVMSGVLLEAGELAMRHFRRVAPLVKEDRTYVTQADLAIQSCLVDRLETAFPEDGIIAEEDHLRKEPASGNRYWVIDPIDGTSSFVGGMPGWGLSVGLVEDSRPIGGWFLMPATGDLFSSPPSRGVQLNKHPRSVRLAGPLHRESILLCTTRPHRYYEIDHAYAGRVKCFGSAAAHLAYVAAGSADAVVLADVYLWDVAAGVAMLLNSGGVFQYLGGEDVDLSDLLEGQRLARTAIGGHPATVKQYTQVISTIE